MNIQPFGKATEEMIARFEKQIGFSLPEDYKQFLRENNGGTSQVRYSSIFVEGLQERIPLAVLYGLEMGERACDLSFWHNEFSDDLLPNSVIIGDDPGAGLFVLFTPLDGGVYYWDHTFYFKQTTQERNIYKVASSFRGFIDNLQEFKG